MFVLDVAITDNSRRVTVATQKAAFRNLRHAGGSLRKSAQGRIDKSAEPSAVGEPPHTRGRGGHNLRGAILFAPGEDDVIVGPRASVIGGAGQAHEHGGTHHGQRFPERPFMRPTLEENEPRFAELWAGTIGGA